MQEAAAQPLLSLYSACTQPLLSHCSVSAHPLLGVCSASAQPLPSLCSPITRSLFSFCSATTLSLLCFCSPTARSLLGLLLPTAQPLSTRTLLIQLRIHSFHIQYLVVNSIKRKQIFNQTRVRYEMVIILVPRHLNRRCNAGISYYWSFIPFTCGLANSLQDSMIHTEAVSSWYTWTLN
jgi:hypothetical protein